MDQIIPLILPELGKKYRVIFMDQGISKDLRHMTDEEVKFHLQALRAKRNSTMLHLDPTLSPHPHLQHSLAQQDDPESLIHRCVTQDLPMEADSLAAGQQRLHKGAVFAHQILRAQLRHRYCLPLPFQFADHARSRPVVQYANLNVTIIHGFYMEMYQSQILKCVSKKVNNAIQTIKQGEPDFVTFKFLVRNEELPRDFYRHLVDMRILPETQKHIYPMHDHRCTWPTVLAFQWRNKRMTKGGTELVFEPQPVSQIPYRHVDRRDLFIEECYFAHRGMLGLYVQHTPQVTEEYQTGHIQCLMMLNYVQAISHEQAWPELSSIEYLAAKLCENDPTRHFRIIRMFNIHNTIRTWYYLFIQGDTQFMTYDEVSSILKRLEQHGICPHRTREMTDNGSRVDFDLQQLAQDMQEEFADTEGGPPFSELWIDTHCHFIVKFWHYQFQPNAYYRTTPMRMNTNGQTFPIYSHPII